MFFRNSRFVSSFMAFCVQRPLLRRLHPAHPRLAPRQVRRLQRHLAPRQRLARPRRPWVRIPIPGMNTSFRC
jgi:hypothetical protein